MLVCHYQHKRKQRWRGCQLKLSSLKAMFAAAAMTAMSPGTAAAALIFSGSGTGTGGSSISAKVTFDFVTHNFGGGLVDAVQVTVENTAATTTVRGNLITGVFFSLPGTIGALPTASAGLDGLAPLVLTSSGTLTNVDIAPAPTPTGGYQLSNGPFGIANSLMDYSMFNHGISTVGGGLNGFNGSQTNGDNYGIVAPGSNVSSGGLAAALPLISGSAIFWIARPGAWNSLDQVGSTVRVGYGSLTDNALDLPKLPPPSNDTPEPASFAMMSIAALVLGPLARRRKRS
jgi:hypothetical protein